jgi:glutamyl-tRNA synthetase
MMDKKVVTRFAPSPTGFMHIGGIRTALFAYLWARKNNGTFILRIEDTDRDREVAGSIEHIQESLRWLGIDWDFGPEKAGAFGSCIQSKRLETYIAAARELLANGYAYPDPYTSEEITGFRALAESEKRPFLMRNHRPEQFLEWDGKTPLRFKVPTIKRFQWHDEVRGDLQAGEEAVDDFILIKGDGYPTYNFAHIIDDQAMGVTHIFRGDEFISSTPRFLSLYEALGIEHPQFVTLPPILRDDKTKKLGKRDGAKDILEYRNEGYLPDAMVNFLALIGWNPGTEQELFSREELLAAFEISRIQTHGGSFNEEKLQWLNREYLLKKTPEELLDYLKKPFQESLRLRGIEASGESIMSMLPIIRDRMQVLSDVLEMVGAGEFDFYFKDPEVDSVKILGTGANVTATLTHLAYVLEQLTALPDDSFKNPEHIKSAIWEYATTNGRGNVLWPLRFALTGRERSPDPFTVASIIGKQSVQRRITSAIATLTKNL